MYIVKKQYISTQIQTELNFIIYNYYKNQMKYFFINYWYMNIIGYYRIIPKNCLNLLV